MATQVFVVVCTEAPVLAATTLASECPAASRLQVVTTDSVLSGLVAPVVDPGVLDPVVVASVFSFAFATVVLFYLVSKGAGSVLRFIRFG